MSHEIPTAVATLEKSNQKTTAYLMRLGAYTASHITMSSLLIVIEARRGHSYFSNLPNTSFTCMTCRPDLSLNHCYKEDKEPVRIHL